MQDFADRSQSWADCDPDLRGHVMGTLAALGLPLLGAYLHGSLAMGCYHRARSDLDLLLVVEEPLGERRRAGVALALARASVARPTPGDLEVSVLTREQAAVHRHPRPYEVHYSSAWTARILAGRVDHAVQGTDPDLAAHVTVTLHRSVTLLGPPPATVFAPVPWDDYVAAVVEDVREACAWERLRRSPVYGVLNACRVLQVLDGGPGTVPSKAEGAAWALRTLPPRLRPVVRQALAAYGGAAPASSASGGWAEEALREFGTYALRHTPPAPAGPAR